MFNIIMKMKLVLCESENIQQVMRMRPATAQRTNVYLYISCLFMVKCVTLKSPKMVVQTLPDTK